MTQNTYDPITLEVLWNRLISTVNEQAAALMHASFTTVVREAGDLSAGGPVNLGNPRESRILDVARLIIKLTGSGSSIEFRPAPEDDPRRRRPDISLAMAELKWEPRIGIEEGLEKTIQYFRGLL